MVVLIELSELSIKSSIFSNSLKVQPIAVYLFEIKFVCGLIKIAI